MKKRTSKKAVLLRSLLLLPLIATLVFGFSETKRIELEKTDASLPDVIIQESNDDETSFIPNQNKPTSNDFEKWRDKNEFAIWIHEKPVDNSVLDDYRPGDFAHYFLSFVYQNARSERFPQPYQLHLYTQDEFKKIVVNDNLLIEVMINQNGQLLVQSELVELDNLASYLLKLNKNLSKEERQKTIRGVIVSDKSASKEVIAAVERILNEYGVAQIDIRGAENTPPPAQNGATQKQLSKYNNVVKDNWLIEIMINRNGQLLAQSELVELDNLASYLQKLNKNLSKEERQKTIRGVIVSDKSAPKEVIADVQRILNEYGVAQIDIRGSEDMPPPAQNGATQKQLSKYNTLAKKYNAQPKSKRVIPSEDLKSLELIYRKMSEKQKADAQPFPECPDSKSSGQEGATEKQMADYNALAKKYNEMLADGGNIRIRKSDIDRLEYLHGIMTEDQRTIAEPFPNFPEPPEPPAPPSPTDPRAKEFAENKIQEIIENQDPHDGLVIDRRMYGIGENKEFLYTVPKVKTYFDMNDEDVTIYLRGKEISHLEMMRMQGEGEITSVNITKNANGQKIIKVADLNKQNIPSMTPPPPSAANKTSANTRQWTVTSGANRDSRNSEASSPIPPVTPTIAMHVDRDNYSKKLKNSINEYLVANKSYEEAISDYRNKSIGSKENLWNMYNEAMEKYVAYHVIAKEEGNFVQPVPAFKERVKVEKNAPPIPQAPPEPKPPLDYIIEMAKKDAIFYYKGKKISSDKAINILKKNKEINIEIKDENGEKPLVKLSTEPITIEN